MKIKLTRVYVDDQEKALRFYTEVRALPRRPISAMGRIAG
jgi:catechol 2,3-dioxygenase-like lactoylglutathione lyase family enzyme